ncbi:hypothetical protein [Croceicoccus marinus]|uniref:hypothetical protein n=1 Tax=Croceicoccus marinus TaxID=450378 RepID=UPI0012FA0B93|nr:hypothetical protein [Croceicoccus marinus]
MDHGEMAQTGRCGDEDAGNEDNSSAMTPVLYRDVFGGVAARCRPGRAASFDAPILATFRFVRTSRFFGEAANSASQTCVKSFFYRFHGV